MKKQHFLRRASALLLATAISVTMVLPAAAEDAVSVTLDKSSLSLTVGESGTLIATVTPDTEAVTWASEDETIAAVEDGVVTAKRIGETVVTATAGEKSAECRVSITAPPITEIIVNEPGRILEPGKSMTLTVTVQPEGADESAVTWHSSDTKVATVDSDGLVTAVGPGEVKIYAKAGDKKSNDCRITVSGIQLEKDSVTLKTGEVFDLVYGQYGNAAVNVAGSPIWTSDRSGVAMVSGNRITAQNPGDATITATAGRYTATCYVTVEENTANMIKRDLTAGETLSFAELRGDLNENSREVTDSPLNYLTNLTVSTSQGILHYGYMSVDDPGLGVGSTERYYYSDSVNGERGLSNVTFVPKAGFNGTASIRYTGYAANGNSFSGEIRVEVEGGSDVAYTASFGNPVQLQSADFSAVCRERLGRDLSYVTFEQPGASRGTLYYNYSGQGMYSEEVSSGTKYNRTRNPYLDNVSFVPAEGYAGTVRVSYRCVDTAGNSFSDRMTITVTGKSETGHGEVNYSTVSGEKVTFKASDFNNACLESNDASLHYVRFSLPDSSKGTLYYNYSSSGNYDGKVSESTRYYRSSTPSLSKVTFVPNRNFTGTVYIDMVGYDTDGGYFEGQVCIQVSGDGGEFEIAYSTDLGRPLIFLTADFNEACLKENGESLDYVRFDLPASSQGTLYYNYTNSGSYSSKVSSSSRYYRSGTPSISKVTFVPKSGYSGTVSIGFSGYDSAGGRFNGTVEIEVTDVQQESIRYSAVSGQAVVFETADFNQLCRDLTDSTLNYVRFQLPSSDQGLLCYQYNTNTGTYSSKVTASTSYYRSGGSRALSEVAFVPNKAYSGTVEVEFTGWSTTGEEFSGIVEIDVTAPSLPTIRYNGSSAPIQIYAADLRNACVSALGQSLSNIQFTSLPGEYAGRLYMGYVSPGQAGAQVGTGVRYYDTAYSGIESFKFVPKAGFQGKAAFRYTGTDVRGREYQGAIEITVSNAFCPNRFADMTSHGWAKPAVEFLYQVGVTSGFTETRFGPAENIRRCDFVLMLCRAFQFKTNSTTSFPDVPADSYYGWAVATAKDLGITAGSNGLFMPNRALTRQEAMVMIKRALIADGWSVPDGDQTVLDSYTDGSKVSAYARDAVATLIQLGAVAGNQAGQLKPLDPISRAEMAVILHRVLTL